MPRTYDMLIIDLDGTLLNSRGEITPADQTALHRARDAGIEVIIATGRTYTEARHALQQIDHDGLFISAGGSMLTDLRSGETLARETVDPDVVHDVTTALLAADLRVLILKDVQRAGFEYLTVGTAPLDPASAWWFERWAVSIRHAADLTEDYAPDETLRLGAVASEPRLRPVAEGLADLLRDRALYQHWGAVTETATIGSATHLLEVFRLGVDKWSMVQRLAEEREVPPARIATVGDGLNDVMMLREAGLGIAMANADPRAAAVANVRVAGHDEGGVAEAIGLVL